VRKYFQVAAHPEIWEQSPVSGGCLSRHTGNWFGEENYNGDIQIVVNVCNVKASDLVNGLREAGLLPIEKEGN
jgi:hypothetical protein